MLTASPAPIPACSVAQQSQSLYQDSQDTDAWFSVQQARRQGNKRSSDCYSNCGASSHTARSPNCPARGQTCRNCLKPNHFAKVCRSAPAAHPPQSRPPSARSDCTEIRTVSVTHVNCEDMHGAARRCEPSFVAGYRCGCVSSQPQHLQKVFCSPAIATALHCSVWIWQFYNRDRRHPPGTSALRI